MGSEVKVLGKPDINPSYCRLSLSVQRCKSSAYSFQRGQPRSRHRGANGTTSNCIVTTTCQAQMLPSFSKSASVYAKVRLRGGNTAQSMDLDSVDSQFQSETDEGIEPSQALEEYSITTSAISNTADHHPRNRQEARERFSMSAHELLYEHPKVFLLTSHIKRAHQYPSNDDVPHVPEPGDDNDEDRDPDRTESDEYKHIPPEKRADFIEFLNTMPGPLTNKSYEEILFASPGPGEPLPLVHRIAACILAPVLPLSELERSSPSLSLQRAIEIWMDGLEEFDDTVDLQSMEYRIDRPRYQHEDMFSGEADAREDASGSGTSATEEDDLASVGMAHQADVDEHATGGESGPSMARTIHYPRKGIFRVDEESN